uniref:Uncharacterized protein n=1 Tax=Kalanchoe fedtschenkoi TaxID=63787 RepID=A0A7N1A119_KALFE
MEIILQPLVDESRDISIKEQMTIAVRYVKKRGEIIGYNITILWVHGQGYDEASNMRGEVNGLMLLIMKDNNSAFCVYCFDHQLQLTFTSVVKKS